MSIIPSEYAHLQDKLAAQLKPNHSYDELDNASKFNVSETLLINIGQTTGKLNQMLMPLLWECYLTGNWEGNPLQAFREWVEDEILPHFPDTQRNYIWKIVWGISNVLTTAYAAEKSGNPIIDNQGEVVTAERLLAEPTKVAQYSYHIAKQAEPEQFIALLPTHSQSELNQLRNADDLIVKLTAETYYHREGGYRIIIDVPDNEKLRLIERLLGKVVYFSIPKSPESK